MSGKMHYGVSGRGYGVITISPRKNSPRKKKKDTMIERVKAASSNSSIGNASISKRVNEHLTHTKKDRKDAAQFIRNYLKTHTISKEDMAKLLIYSDYPADEVMHAIAQCGVNWPDQAKETADILLSEGKYTRTTMEEELLARGFHSFDIDYALEQFGDYWHQQIMETIKQKFETCIYSQGMLVEELIDEGNDLGDVLYGIAQSNIDWKDQARQCANYYTAKQGLNTDETIDALLEMGFTAAEVRYAVKALYK